MLMRMRCDVSHLYELGGMKVWVQENGGIFRREECMV